ncbi:MAG: penicillin-binding protein 1C [Deltaproteobacteria bacterium]|nr:penicillin-binding protein 1C [Deltaproteobacteria bacterium]
MQNIRNLLLKKRSVFFTGGALILLFFFYNCLPDPLFNDPISSVLLSSEGKLLSAKIAKDQQWRFPYNTKISEKFETAIILYEDKRFYYHPGFDPLAIVRSLYLNLKADKTVSGASTISMQVIRLARKNKKRTYFEKLIELILALRLEVKYSKEEILALYASYAPFGGNVVGLETASFRYFERASSNLSWAEACTLAVLPNSPSLIHPGRNRKKLKDKRDKLLKTLFEKKIISNLDYRLSKIEEVPQNPKKLPQMAQHLMNSLDRSNKKRSVLKTTLKYNIQKNVTKILNDHSKDLLIKDIHNGAVIVIDNENLEVIAYVGNTNTGKKVNKGNNVDIVRSPRSTGSILKPFLFASMLEKSEILPDTLVSDIPTQYNGYIPENFDEKYRGVVTAKAALSKSLNIPAVRMLRQHGIHRFYDFLKNFGITTLHRDADDYGLTLILGGAEGTLYDIAGVYANLVRISENPDKYASHKFDKKYQKIKVLKDREHHKGDLSISSGSAYLTMQALLEVVRPGTENFWKKFSSSRKVAWKTGTSYGLRDAWAIGCTKKYTVAVWIGNATGEGKPGLVGVTVAAPVMFDIFNFLPESKWIEEPESDLKTVKICNKSGKFPTTLCETKDIKIPVNSHYSDICTYHKRIHVDKKGYRVNSNCESVSKITPKVWFVLPPLQAFYYKRKNASYKNLPMERSDCQRLSSIEDMEIVYPPYGTSLFIPIDLDEKISATVFEAVHRGKDSIIYWHLDDKYLGTTSFIHKISYAPKPGKHKLILVDNKGIRVERQFKVIGK